MPKKMYGLCAALAVLVCAASLDKAAAENDGREGRMRSTKVSVSTASTEQRFTAYITGYGYWDNTPPGSAAISKPVVHRQAGGTGTYDDPVTIAVGHTIKGGNQTLDYAPGTRFYIERLRKYAIVEDVCGDGNTPQAGPCHTGYKGYPWLDIYIGGGKHNAATTVACARQITALQNIVINPKPDYSVFAGEITDSGCKVF
ncbi:MAG: hypothetical protein U1D35_02040 [Paracoccaceae bacterium]|nr:hypothetical protein [Paracoccaceae bacterium]